MRVWLKLLTVCLLALALPAQGIASATMLHCQQGQAHADPAAQRVGHDAEHRAMAGQHDQHAQHAHHEHAKHASDADQPSSADADGLPFTVAADAASPHTGHHAGHGAHTCSACAACCAGFALLNTMPQVVAPELAPTVFSVLMPSVAPYATAGPDRPPRVFLA